MRRALTLTVLITRHSDGFTAVCPALPNCRITATSRSKAYAELKTLIYQRLEQLMTRAEPLPIDPIVSVKLFRTDLLRLWKEVDLQ